MTLVSRRPSLIFGFLSHTRHLTLLRPSPCEGLPLGPRGGLVRGPLRQTQQQLHRRPCVTCSSFVTSATLTVAFRAVMGNSSNISPEFTITECASAQSRASLTLTQSTQMDTSVPQRGADFLPRKSRTTITRYVPWSRTAGLMSFSDKVWNKLNIKGLATVRPWVSGNLDVNTDFSLLTAHWQDTTSSSNGLHVPHFHTLSFMLCVFLFYHSSSVLGPCLSEDYVMVLGLCPATHLWRVHRGRVFSTCTWPSVNLGTISLGLKSSTIY